MYMQDWHACAYMCVWRKDMEIALQLEGLNVSQGLLGGSAFSPLLNLPIFSPALRMISGYKAKSLWQL